MTATRTASATDVRTWALSKGFEVKERGRLDADVIDAYNKGRKVKYAPAMKQPTRVIKLAGKRADKSGRNRSITVTTTVPEVRAWATENGHEVGTRGRIPQGVFEAFATREAKPTEEKAAA